MSSILREPGREMRSIIVDLGNFGCQYQSLYRHRADTPYILEALP